MCTVVFIPGNEKHFFASLRDESPLRPPAEAPKITGDELKILSPKDLLAGGTWIGVNDFGNVIILLNGGFEKHIRANSYWKSRGLIVSELLTSQVPVVDWNLMNLEKIEPFTLIVWSDENLFQLVWDGLNKHRIRVDQTIPHLWSSSTLYDSEAKLSRDELFQNWITMNPPVSKLTLLRFFNSSSDAINGYIINRAEKVKTLSYTFVELADNNAVVMNYYDISNYTYHRNEMNLNEMSIGCELHDRDETKGRNSLNQ